ncbi:Imm63 family immunity protein [Alteromonas ponticola]|uniref:Immunity protein 63 domain-containing protein n=1 Tax=Alteromonas ponticola TaxID=2720613 RepID=A0ABX1R3F7_9ALTE|nr:Imm63 family immunity protein [Alteromonas ponticola]NMH60978.1 hypothetical protein [Alteromonas ponticola]
MHNFETMTADLKKLGAIIDAPSSLLSGWGIPKEDGTPYIEIGDDVYLYLSSERGYQIFKKEVSNYDELLYLIFSNITHKMAVNYELRNRNSEEDCRRTIFSKQLELLGTVKAEWRCKREKEIEAILRNAPFED